MLPFCDNPTVLISDDDRDLREALGQVLGAEGFETHFAGDGRAAYELVCRENIHLVIIDFHMPRMTGLDALKLIKQEQAQLPVILMSAQLDDPMRKQIMEADAFSVHSKPLDICQIRQDVSRALRQCYDWPESV